MSRVTIRVPIPLRGYAQRVGEVQVEAGSAREALSAMFANVDRLARRCFTARLRCGRHCRRTNPCAHRPQMHVHPPVTSMVWRCCSGR